MEAMTLETALSAIDRSISTLREAGYPLQAAELSEARVPVARQFAQPAQAVDVDYVPGELDRTAPERVWLQIDTSASNDVRNEAWPGADGVTWQDESIGGLEIQYVRADLATRALSGEKAGPVDGWTARRDDDLRLWWVYSPSGNAAGIYDQAAGVHAELLRQLAQSLPASPTPGKEGA